MQAGRTSGRLSVVYPHMRSSKTITNVSRFYRKTQNYSEILLIGELNQYNVGSENINYITININIQPKISDDPKIKERCNMSSIRGDIFASVIIALVSHKSIFDFNVTIADCGKKMNDQFQKYYKYKYFEINNFNRDEFKNVAFEFLKEHEDNYINFWRGFSVFSDIPGIARSKTRRTGETQDITPLPFGLETVKDYENLNKHYLFSWEDIPGNDRKRITDFLKSKYDLEWVKEAKITKTNNHMTIMIIAGTNLLSLNLNNEKTEMNLQINSGKTDKFVVKTENDKLNIYSEIKIHKGTPYYWLGLYYIDHDQLLKGFSYMHQALTEDEDKNHIGAAKSFVTLNSGLPIIMDVVKFIDDKLIKYYNSKRGKLVLNDFRSKFLRRPDLRDIIFQFGYAAFRLKEMVDIDKELMQNDFAALSQKDIIFDFCTIIENIIKTQNKYPNVKDEKENLYNFIAYLSRIEKLIINVGNNLGNINNEAKVNFSDTLQSLLNSNYPFVKNQKKQSIDEDLAILLIIRNNIHEIKSWPIIYQNFDKIIERILNCLFFSIEKLCIEQI